MGTYRALCPVISQAQAEEFGRWLGQYRIQISGLRVDQIGEDGHSYRDNAAAHVVSTAAQGVGGGLASSALAPVIAPVVAALASPAALLALAAANIGALLLHYKAAKTLPGFTAPVRIVATELTFDLAGVSAQRRKWSEYLLSIYGALHKWQKIDGMTHPEQWAVGAAYAARTGSYPQPWSQQPRLPSAAPVRQSTARRTRRPKPTRQTVSPVRRLWWRITDEF